MHSKAFLKTGGKIMSIRGRTHHNNLKSNFISKMLNNKSITTNESSGINNSGININKNIFNLKRDYKLKFPSESLNYSSLNTIGITGQSTWYHTKTVNSIHKEKKQLLVDADTIMKERMKTYLGGAYKDRKKSKILENSKEICRNNFMITQLRDKRTEINNKEKFIDMALKSSERQYEKDYRSFIDFVEEIKRKEKKEEEVLNKVKNKKDSTESNLTKEINLNKKLEEKCEIIIKTIVLLKNYGSFVHNVFKTPFIYDELSNAKLIGKKYISLKDKIISIYDKNNLNNNINEEDIEIDNILENDERLMRQYNNYEQKLVQILDDKDNLDKEINNIITKNNIELNILKQKLEENEKEYERIKLDKKRMLSSMKEFQLNNITEIEEYLQYIIDLGNELGIDTHKNSKTKSNNIHEYLYYCKDTLAVLEHKEILINHHIEEIEKILKCGDENDKNIIQKLLIERKKLIKKEKQLMLKQQKDEENRIKKLKAIERAKRIVIRGRKVFDDLYPRQNKQKNSFQNDSLEEDENQYLYYSDD